MRRRLLLSTVGAAAAAVLLFGLPLALLVRAQITTQALDAQQAQAEAIQALLNRQPMTLEDADLLLNLTAGNTASRLTLLDRAGRIVIDTGRAPRGAVARSPDLSPALEGGVGRHVGEQTLAVSVPVTIRGAPLILRVERTDAALRSAVLRSWGAIGGLAVAALGVSAIAAGWQGRRLARPLEDLAASARRLGEGDFSVRAGRSGLPETDDVASALDSTAARLGAVIERSRSFGADASHQLRTPLTALRLHLDALEVHGGESAARAAALESAQAEADRLEATITELLELAASPAGEGEVDLAALAAERLPSWQRLAQTQGRVVVLQSVPVPPVRARAAALGQCLQVLLDNALAHGAGTVTVTVQPTARPGGVRLCVADEGPGVPEEVAAAVLEVVEGRVPPARGRGLRLARALVEAEGGRLRLERTGDHAMVCIVLPAA